MRFLVQLLILLSLSLGALAKKSSSPDDFAADPTWVKKELKKMKLKNDFIKDAMEFYETDTFATVLKLNLLGFLGAPGQHMDRVTSQSVQETAEFLKENKKYFDKAEKKYKVPANVVSALLWIETRHGDDTGKFHILSVYLHLLQAELPTNRLYLTELALEKNKDLDAYSEDELIEVMKERLEARTEWARDQIKALAEMHRKKKLDVRTLKGSYAGAFGMPQFIPTSYRDFARAAKSKAAPDLSKPSDAIMSVAYYLSKHGWKGHRRKTHIAALMKYNNSRDYAESILEISKKACEGIDEPKKREVSSVETGSHDP